MDGQLVQVCRPINSSLELIALVATLRQEKDTVGGYGRL
jgi:hypothetical protein